MQFGHFSCIYGGGLNFTIENYEIGSRGIYRTI